MPKLDRYQEEQETVTLDRCHWLLETLSCSWAR